MSTRDMNLEITDAYKKIDGGYMGHNLPLMAEHSGIDTRVFDDILPNCGPLLIINENKQRYPVSGSVTFTYNIAIVSGYSTEKVNDVSYERAVYSGTTDEFSGTVYFEEGLREYSQQIFNDHSFIRKVNSMSVDDALQEVRIYCMADDGSRLLYGMHNELIRNLNDIVERGMFISPPKCLLCGGTGIYQGDMCTDCNGYDYVGRNAEQWLLTQRNKDISVYKRDESEKSFQYRGWAKKWWVIPTKTQIKEYFGHFVRTSADNITIEEIYQPEAYWILRFPAVSAGSLGVGDILSLTGSSLDDLLLDITPAGTQPVLEGYYLIEDESAIHDYCHDFSEAPHLTGITPNYGFNFPIASDGWAGPSFGAEFGGMFFGDDKYFNVDSGIISIAGTGSWHGDNLYVDTGYWSGVNADTFDEIIRFDTPFTGAI